MKFPTRPEWGSRARAAVGEHHSGIPALFSDLGGVIPREPRRACRSRVQPADAERGKGSR